jgi:hypothetical protein
MVQGKRDASGEGITWTVSSTYNCTHKFLFYDIPKVHSFAKAGNLPLEPHH